jgi:hypothetical protein
MKKSNWLVLAMAAGAVGGAIAWIMTTEKGQEFGRKLRDDILDEADRLLGNLENRLDELSQQAREMEEKMQG